MDKCMNSPDTGDGVNFCGKNIHAHVNGWDTAKPLKHPATDATPLCLLTYLLQTSCTLLRSKAPSLYSEYPSIKCSGKTKSHLLEDLWSLSTSKHVACRGEIFAIFPMPEKMFMKNAYHTLFVAHLPCYLHACTRRCAIYQQVSGRCVSVTYCKCQHII